MPRFLPSWRVEATTVIQLFLASVIGWFLPNRSCNGSWTHRWGCKGVSYGKKISIHQVRLTSRFEVNITSSNRNRVHFVIGKQINLWTEYIKNAWFFLYTSYQFHNNHPRIQNNQLTDQIISRISNHFIYSFSL